MTGPSVPASARHAALCVLVAMLAGQVASAQPGSFAPIVRSQRAKVVHINTDTHKGGNAPAGAERFRLPDPTRGSGSGFIISGDGYIVTNHHVVEDTDEIEVVLSDERKFSATVVGKDAQTDLALIKIAATNLPAVEFGDSNRLEVGDWVLAIGNPLGLDHTVTAGIISAKGRNIFDQDNLAYGEFLQTDAAINPGNSGGPLFNLAGQVIGVNSAVSRRGQGIGFAVPSNLVVKIVEQLRSQGRVNRGWLGVAIREVTLELAGELVLPEGTRGVLIEDVLPGSPALGSGLAKGDVLIGYGRDRLQRVAQLQKLVALTAPGSEVELEALRREMDAAPWKPVRLRLRIGVNPTNEAAEGASAVSRLGLSVLTVPEDLRNRLGLDTGGVLVDSVVAGSAAESAGLQAGDIILEVDQTDVESRDALNTTLMQAETARISIVVRRGSKILYLVIQRGDLRP